MQSVELGSGFLLTLFKMGVEGNADGQGMLLNAVAAIWLSKFPAVKRSGQVFLLLA
jgi:hypothetical protein